VGCRNGLDADGEMKIRQVPSKDGEIIQSPKRRVSNTNLTISDQKHIVVLINCHRKHLYLVLKICTHFERNNVQSAYIQLRNMYSVSTKSTRGFEKL
jgi:hypothetical protein